MINLDLLQTFLASMGNNGAIVVTIGKNHKNCKKFVIAIP